VLSKDCIFFTIFWGIYLHHCLDSEEWKKQENDTKCLYSQTQKGNNQFLLFYSTVNL